MDPKHIVEFILKAIKSPSVELICVRTNNGTTAPTEPLHAGFDLPLGSPGFNPGWKIRDPARFRHKSV